jgi:hypothetical protein
VIRGTPVRAVTRGLPRATYRRRRRSARGDPAGLRAREGSIAA